jgi:hypothetical protein
VVVPARLRRPCSGTCSRPGSRWRSTRSPATTPPRTWRRRPTAPRGWRPSAWLARRGRSSRVRPARRGHVRDPDGRRDRELGIIIHGSRRSR